MKPNSRYLGINIWAVKKEAMSQENARKKTL